MQIDWWTLGLQTINFLVVVWLLSRFLYRPVRRIIEEREAADRRLSDEALAKAEAADRKREDYESKLAEFADEQRKREAQLHSAMEGEREAALKKARDAADTLMAEARATLDREREEALDRLKDEIGALAVELARAALASGVTQDAALRQANGYFDRLSPQDLADLKRDVAEAGAQATVVTAEPLDENARSSWRACLSERLGDGTRVSFSEDPEVLGGAELHFPHAVLNLSVAQRLKDAAGDVKA